MKGVASSVHGAVQGGLGAKGEAGEPGAVDEPGRGGGGGAAATAAEQHVTTAQHAAVADGFAVNGGERVDWMLQETELEMAQEYWAALLAHSSYFTSEDLAAFIVNDVVPGVN